MTDLTHTYTQEHMPTCAHAHTREHGVREGTHGRMLFLSIGSYPKRFPQSTLMMALKQVDSDSAVTL